MATFKPCSNYVAVRHHSAPDQTDGGIALPDIAKGDPRTGVIVGVGPKVEDERLKPGVVVYCPPAGGAEAEVNKTTLKVYPEEEILGILEG